MLTLLKGSNRSRMRIRPVPLESYVMTGFNLAMQKVDEMYNTYWIFILSVLARSDSSSGEDGSAAVALLQGLVIVRFLLSVGLNLIA